MVPGGKACPTLRVLIWSAPSPPKINSVLWFVSEPAMTSSPSFPNTKPPSEPFTTTVSLPSSMNANQPKKTSTPACAGVHVTLFVPSPVQSESSEPIVSFVSVLVNVIEVGVAVMVRVPPSVGLESSLKSGSPSPLTKRSSAYAGADEAAISPTASRAVRTKRCARERASKGPCLSSRG